MSANIANAPAHLIPFLLIIKDWIYNLSDGDKKGELYRDTLKGHLPDNTLVRHWSNQVVDAPLTLQTLLYRHYLMRYVVSEEIFPHLDAPPLYVMMTALLMRETFFYPFDKSVSWIVPSKTNHPLILLRNHQLSIQDYAHHLEMREDVTDHQLIRDHGLLSSLLLVYGCHLVHIILTEESIGVTNPALTAILRMLSLTLTRFEGVFTNGQI